MATSRLDVDLSSIERNLSLIRSVVALEGESRGGDGRPKAHKVSVCGVLKQDAYGAGSARIAKRLAAMGVEMFSVYTLDEARLLADAVPAVPILVLMPVFGVDRQDPLYRHAAQGRVHLTLHSAEQFAGISEMAARIGMAMPLHVQVDSGLSRGGGLPTQSLALIEKVLASPKVRLSGLMTHFASPCCDEAFTKEQSKIFRDVVEHAKPAIRQAFAGGGMTVMGAGKNITQDIALHAANSCATFRSRSLHGSMVRCGQSLLGYLMDDDDVPEEFEFSAQARALEPALRWTSSAVHLTEIPAGWPVGYGSTWRAPYRTDGRKTRIALIPVGYADGYPRSLGGKGGGGPGWVGFTGRLWERRGSAEAEDSGRDDKGAETVYAPVVGRVSMDQITVDVTDVPASHLRFGLSGSDMVGPEVELYSRKRGTPNFLPALAAKAGSITHELLCRIGPRVERAYKMPKSETAGHIEPGPLPIRGTTGGIGGTAAVAR